MEAKETTHLLCGKSIYETIRLNGCKEGQEDTASVNSNLRYYTIDPMWMNVRLCIFWLLWATLLIVLIMSILSYCCLLPQTCKSSQKVIILNDTST